MDLGLTGSTAVVTGGSKGMGLAIAQTLAADGASVAVMARGQAALDAAVDSLRAAGAPDAVGISVDMTDAASIAGGFDEVSKRWGRLNSLVHTIGPGDGFFEQMEDADWDTAFALGTMSGVRSVRAALPMLRAADWARIVTLSAHSIQRQSPRIVAYTASKAALSSITKNLSKSLAKDRHPGELRLPGHDCDRELHGEPQRHSRRRRARRIRPARRDDVDRKHLPPAVRPRAGRAPRGNRVHHHLPGVPDGTDMSPGRRSTSTADRTSSRSVA